MNALVLLAMLQVTPVDTIVQTVTVPRPAIVVVGDTTIVNVEVHTDSLAAAIDRGAQAALNQAITDCECTGSDYHWEVRAGLTLLAYGLYELRKWRKSRFPDEIDVDVDVDVEVEAPKKPPYPRKPHG